MSGLKHQIVVVDDDRDARFLLRYLIVRHYPNATVSEAADGETALKLYSQTANLFVVDYRMPRLDGLEVTRQLRKQSKVLPIIMVSSLQISEQEVLAAGANSFVDKVGLVSLLPKHLSSVLPQ
ncbi:response regulator [Pedosphaera parvula]|uniref:Response regulator receiver protein n=1 Tax=Pedosphaera parvula (strain Ellin514) TaxID=320771 RepID=B9XHY3_PEDPL|nr:response regulator transcription factor [Pedosphaera parvula]EEF60476.1 response regulator receiver protein [Pedosphaera parvula Ellin514]